MIFRQVLHKIRLNPQKLFLIDGLGALISAFLLGVVLAQLENIFGLPQSTLYFLASIPLVFFIYDLYCYLNVKKDIGLFLKIIAVSNLIYCFISIALAFYHYHEITYWGWTYVALEIIIIIVLVYTEYTTAIKLSSKN